MLSKRTIGWLRGAWLPAALVLGTFVATMAPVADGDLFFHLAAGREMVRAHALIRTDPFSVSAAGRPWPDVHWLFQLAVYGVHVLGGLRAVVLAKCAVLALSAAVLLKAVDRRAWVLFVPAFLGAVLLCRNLLLVRPVVVTLVMLAVFFMQLERFRRERRQSALVPLPFLQIVWANVQGLFALGPLVIGAYAAGALATAAFGDRTWFPFAREGRSREGALGRFKPLAATCALGFIASLVTPFGLGVFTLPMRLLGRITPAQGNVFSAQVAENVPPFVLERTFPSEVWHLKWFLACLAVSVLLGARRLPLAHLLLLAGFVVLALMGNRNVALLYFVAPAVVAQALAPRLQRVRRWLRASKAGTPSKLFAPLVVGALGFVTCVAAAREPSLAQPAPFRFPVESASVIAKLPRTGTIFCADHQGDYLMYRLHPRFRPFIDTRLILRTAAEYEEYLGLLDHPERFDAFARRYEFSAVVLPTAYPDRYLGLIRHLYFGRDFKLAYTNGSEVLFLRREGWADDGIDLGDRKETNRLVVSAKESFVNEGRLLSAALLHIATLDIVVGQLGEARHVLSVAGSEDADALSGRIALAEGDLDGAEKLGMHALDGDPRDVRALDLLASISARRGELRRASGFLRQALALDPYDGEASSLLASMEEHQHER